MTNQYQGLAANVANNLPATSAVSAATNATPIVVTTGTAHGLNTGDVFSISGVVGNTAANGTFLAGTVTGTTVALTAYPGGSNVAGSGAYTSGGTVQPLSFGASLPIPVDSDRPSGALFGVPLEALADRTAFLMYSARTAFSLIAPPVAVVGNPWNETPVADGAYHDTTAPHVDLTGCKVGDLVFAWFSGQVTTGGTGSGGLSIGFRDDFLGSNVLADTTTVQYSTTVTAEPMSVANAHYVTNAGTTRVVIRLEASAAAVINLNGIGTLLAIHVKLGV